MHRWKTARALQHAILLILALLVAVPALSDAAPRKVTKEVADQLFRGAATPNDVALAKAVKDRLQAIRAQSATPTPAAGPGAKGFWWDQLTVDTRSGYVRLGGPKLTSQQRATVEGVVKATPGVESWDWGNSPAR